MDLDAHRGDGGTYVVAKRKVDRDPIDWLLFIWVVVGTIAMAKPFVGIVRWLAGW